MKEKPRLVIRVNQYGKDVLDALTDLALRSGGRQNLELVMDIEDSIEVLPDQLTPNYNKDGMQEKGQTKEDKKIKITEADPFQ